MVNWTEEDYAALVARKQRNLDATMASLSRDIKTRHKTVQREKEPLSDCWRKLLGIPGVTEKPTPGKMNKWEEQHARNLFNRIMANEISGYYFERFRFEIGHRCLYIPDFVLLLNDGTFAADEVKGFMRDDANVKIKVAARMYPAVAFTLWTKEKGVWVSKVVER